MPHPLVKRPAVGRHVWYRGRPYGGVRLDPQPMHAVICYVWNERLVNLLVVDHDGTSFSMPSVHLRQRGDEKPLMDHYCEWPTVDDTPQGDESQTRVRSSLATFDEALSGEPRGD